MIFEVNIFGLISASLFCDCEKSRKGVFEITGELVNHCAWFVTHSRLLCHAGPMKAAVQGRLFDMRSEEERLGVWAGAGTDGGRE